MYTYMYILFSAGENFFASAQINFVRIVYLKNCPPSEFFNVNRNFHLLQRFSESFPPKKESADQLKVFYLVA